jgi:GTPase SAR1 family protein
MTDKEDVPRLLKSEHVVEHIIDSQKVMFLGADESGKTALAKSLFRGLHKRGL